MMTFSLDTNCLIHLDNCEPEAEHIDALIGAHRAGTADVAVIAVSASERQPGDYYLPTYRHFMERLERLGIADLPQIKGTGYIGISYIDHCLWSGDLALDLERRIHDCLFPRIEFSAADFRSAKGLRQIEPTDRQMKKWRNAWCDRQMILASILAGRDVFVTSDSDFDPLRDSTTFPELRVCRPEEAARLIAF